MMYYLVEELPTPMPYDDDPWDPILLAQLGVRFLGGEDHCVMSRRRQDPDGKIWVLVEPQAAHRVRQIEGQMVTAKGSNVKAN